MILANAADSGELPGNFRSGGGRAVVHEDDLVVWIGQASKGFQARFERAGAIVAGDHNGNFRIAREREIRRGPEHFLNRPKRFFGFAVAPGQTKAPVFNLLFAPEPVVRVAEKDRARQPNPKCRFDLPGEDFALERFALPQGIDAEFAQDQRFGVRQHLQSGQIIFKWLAVMEVNVEANEIDGLRAKEFGRGIRSESGEAVRIRGFGNVHQFLDEVRDAAHATPANNFGWNLVHHAVSKNRWVALAGLDRCPDRVARLRLGFFRFEKAKVFLPGNIHQQFDLVLGRQVQKPARWHVINAQEIRAQLAELQKIPDRLLARGEHFLLLVRGKRTIGQTPGVKLFSAEPEKFSIHVDTRRGHTGNSHRNRLFFFFLSHLK